MVGSRSLTSLLEDSAQLFGETTAIQEPGGGNLTYADLQATALSLAALLRDSGVRPGDRVGIFAPKSIGVVASIFGILSARAAYVPVDSTAPLARAAFIFGNCGTSTLIVARAAFDGLQAALKPLSCEAIGTVEIRGCADPELIVARCSPRTAPGHDEHPTVDDLAYILYTSGSTGVPKGVMHSHATALSFIDWCSDEFAPTSDDRFSSHAPFHFDLSIFDLYVSVKHGATLVLIGEDLGKQPLRLAQLIAEQRLTIWYSTPSILRILVEFGRLDSYDCSCLRLIIYAGEVFPTKHQRALRRVLPDPKYYNLYGPTETNVCTFDRVEFVPPDDHAVQPIGRACSGDRTRVVGPDGVDVAPGEEGELLVAGGSVMLGYWALPERNAQAFVTDADGIRWYRTGDLVVDRGDGYYMFLGRRDRMVKRRGYRVELGEIEAALHKHPSITEAAVIAVPDAESGVVIRAFINWTGEGVPSMVELKSFAARNLPGYMVPDRFSALPALPKTSTDKVDYQRLKELA